MKLNAWLLPMGVLLVLASAGLRASVGAPVSSPPRATRSPSPASAAPPVGATRPAATISQGIDRQLLIPVGPPDAALAVWILEPKAGTAIRGTVLFIHGFGTDHTSVANAGEALRRAGYRSVLVDMRGFGNSTGVHADFGVTDARDLKQLITFLQKQHWCGDQVGVYGTSLGAAVGLMLAGADARVTSVVAVAPFADIRAEVPSFVRGALGTLGSKMDENELNAAGSLVGRLAHWNLDNARPIEAIKQTKAEILLIHGDADAFIPHAASEQLHAAAPDHTMLITPHNRGHVDLCFDIPGELQGVTRDWFSKTLRAQ